MATSNSSLFTKAKASIWQSYILNYYG